MRTYPNAAQGLHKVFLAQILPVVGVVLVLFPSVPSNSW